MKYYLKTNEGRLVKIHIFPSVSTREEFQDAVGSCLEVDGIRYTPKDVILVAGFKSYDIVSIGIGVLSTVFFGFLMGALTTYVLLPIGMDLRKYINEKEETFNNS